MNISPETSALLDQLTQRIEALEAMLEREGCFVRATLQVGRLNGLVLSWERARIWVEPCGCPRMGLREAPVAVRIAVVPDLRDLVAHVRWVRDETIAVLPTAVAHLDQLLASEVKP